MVSLTAGSCFLLDNADAECHDVFSLCLPCRAGSVALPALLMWFGSALRCVLSRPNAGIIYVCPAEKGDSKKLVLTNEESGMASSLSNWSATVTLVETQKCCGRGEETEIQLQPKGGYALHRSTFRQCAKVVSDEANGICSGCDSAATHVE